MHTILVSKHKWQTAGLCRPEDSFILLYDLNLLVPGGVRLFASVLIFFRGCLRCARCYCMISSDKVSCTRIVPWPMKDTDSSTLCQHHPLKGKLEIPSVFVVGRRCQALLWVARSCAAFRLEAERLTPCQCTAVVGAA